MATSGTTTFNPEFTEIAEEAWERAGREMRSGYDLRTARRSMNLLTIEWQNRGINMWTLEEGTQALTASTASYNLSADTVDLLEYVIRTDAGNTSKQTDFNLERISFPTYSSIPNKLTTGRPLQILISRDITPSFTLWPIPNDNSYTLVYWRMRRIEDSGTGVNTADMPFRFYPALVSGLAYYIASKVPEFAPRLPQLKMDYEEQFLLASGEDRERATMHVRPRFR